MKTVCLALLLFLYCAYCVDAQLGRIDRTADLLQRIDHLRNARLLAEHAAVQDLFAAERSRKLCLERDDTASAMKAQQSVAIAYLNMGFYDEALTSLRDVLRWLERRTSRRDVSASS